MTDQNDETLPPVPESSLDPRYACPHCGLPLGPVDEPPVQDDVAGDKQSFRRQIDFK